MEIGTAIFLSTALISLLFLIVTFGTRIRWRKLVLYSVTLVVLMSLSFYVFHLPIWWRGSVNELGGVKLGETKRDLLFKKGTYKQRCMSDDGTTNYFFYEQSPYGDDHSVSLSVDLLDDSVRRISMTGDHLSERWNLRSPVSSSDNETSIRAKFGEEDFFIETATYYRQYVWRDYNLALALNSNRLTSIIVFDQQYYYKSPDWKTETKPYSECVDQKGNKQNFFDRFD